MYNTPERIIIHVWQPKTLYNSNSHRELEIVQVMGSRYREKMLDETRKCSNYRESTV